jgi:hypothetical protein
MAASNFSLERLLEWNSPATVYFVGRGEFMTAWLHRKLDG